MEKITEYINRIEAGIQEASGVNHKDLSNSRLTYAMGEITGMSSAKNRLLLKCLVAPTDRYLEIGVLKGSMFIPAVAGKECYAVAIDNFSQFGKKDNMEVFINNCKEFNVQYVLIPNDCFALLPEEKDMIHDMTIYFYDGDHHEEDHRKALTYYIDMLSDVFIYVVDDWNYEPARIGTWCGIKDTEIIVHKEWELFSPKNGDFSSWWNGIYVAVCEKAKT